MSSIKKRLFVYFYFDFCFLKKKGGQKLFEEPHTYLVSCVHAFFPIQWIFNIVKATLKLSALTFKDFTRCMSLSNIVITRAPNPYFRAKHIQVEASWCSTHLIFLEVVYKRLRLFAVLAPTLLAPAASVSFVSHFILIASFHFICSANKPRHARAALFRWWIHQLLKSKQ